MLDRQTSHHSQNYTHNLNQTTASPAPLKTAPAPDLRDSSRRHKHSLDLSSRISFKLVSGEEHVLQFLKQLAFNRRFRQHLVFLGTNTVQEKNSSDFSERHRCLHTYPCPRTLPVNKSFNEIVFQILRPCRIALRVLVLLFSAYHEVMYPRVLPHIVFLLLLPVLYIFQ